MRKVARRVTVRRLRALASFLRGVPNRKWDFSAWARSERYAVGPDLLPVKLSLHKCTTVACAAGWATTIPLFRRAGLRLDNDNIPIVRDGMYRFKGSDAMAEVLGITLHEASDAFCRAETYGFASGLHGRVTAPMVARHLEGLADRYEPEP